LGIREYVSNFVCLKDLLKFDCEIEDYPKNLLSFSMCDNFSGKKLSPELVKSIKQSKPNLKILIDAAAYVPTSKLNLSEIEGILKLLFHFSLFLFTIILIALLFILLYFILFLFFFLF